MDRDTLEALGLDGKQIDKVMALHGKVVNPLLTANETLTTTNAKLEKDLTTAQEEIQSITGLSKSLFNIIFSKLNNLVS